MTLTVVAATMLFTSNPYQGSMYFQSSNLIIGNIQELSFELNSYLLLRKQNDLLVAENASLKRALNYQYYVSDYNSAHLTKDSSAFAQGLYFAPAKVIHHTTGFFHNYITIDIGSEQGIAPGMGVVTREGVVGKVKACSKNFATVTSLLHKDVYISAILKRTKTQGSVKWDGARPDEASLLYIPRHIKLKIGDTVVTSQYNAVFPEGILIGRVVSSSAKGSDSFHKATLKLSTDFKSLHHVYVIRHRLDKELDSLQTLNPSHD